jgi:aldose sugar dehydrogenase
LKCKCKFIYLISLFTILASIIIIYDGYFSSVFATKAKSYKDVNITDPNLTFQPIASGFEFPTGMAFLGLNDILVIEKNTGNVIRIQNGTELKEPILHVNVANLSERGLLGIAVSQNNYNNTSTFPYVFLFYTETDKNDSGKILGNRLYRYDFMDDKLINPKLLLDLPYLPGPSHDGGVLKIGPDNKSVYLVIGNLNFAQNQTYMTKAQNVKDGPAPDGRGGILRITFDGDVVGGKGILGEESPLNKYYAYGLRNSFGIGFDPLTGNLWDTENGQSKHDEINLVMPGFNSGWKVIQGPSSFKKDFARDELEDFGGIGVYRDPEFGWFDAIAPTSVLFFNSDKLGDEYDNDLFVGSVKNGTLYHFDLNEDRTQLDLDGPLADKIADTSAELQDGIFSKRLGIITDLQVGPDGNMYVLADYKRDGTIFRLSPIDSTTNANNE